MLARSIGFYWHAFNNVMETAEALAKNNVILLSMEVVPKNQMITVQITLWIKGEINELEITRAVSLIQ